MESSSERITPSNSTTQLEKKSSDLNSLLPEMENDTQSICINHILCNEEIHFSPIMSNETKQPLNQQSGVVVSLNE